MIEKENNKTVDLAVRTSDNLWLEKALKLYSKKALFTLIDDASLGLTEDDLKTALKLIKAAKSRAHMSIKEIVGTITSFGIAASGIYLIILAVVAPEPTTKLGILTVGGVVLALTGSLGALAFLGVRFSVSAKTKQGEFTIKPE